MRSVGVMGLVLASVLGLLALTQFAAIQSSLEALTSGPLQTYLGTFQFFGILLVILIAVTGLASVVLIAAGLMASGARVSMPKFGRGS